MQSQYHNLPLINGTGQKDGKQYAARNTSYNRGTLRMDIAGCYPDSAGITTWIRTVKATPKAVEVTEDYALSSRKGTTAIMLMTVTKPDVSRDGIIALGNGHCIVYNPSQLNVSTEDISPLLDNHLRGMWGEKMYRIIMTVKGNGLEEKLKYKVM